MHKSQLNKDANETSKKQQTKAPVTAASKQKRKPVETESDEEYLPSDEGSKKQSKSNMVYFSNT